MPDNIVGQTVDLVACAPGHLGETFGLGLVFEGVGGEVDAYWKDTVSGNSLESQNLQDLDEPAR